MPVAGEESAEGWTIRPTHSGEIVRASGKSPQWFPSPRARPLSPGGRIVWRVATLYRCSTPTDWLCPCGKVARALRREGIRYEPVVVPQRRSRRPEVEALTGQRRVPVLVIDGETICDSRRIIEYLDFRRSSASASPGPAA